MKTIRTATVDKLILRLVEKDRRYIGLIVSDGVKKAQIEGVDCDDVWRRLHDEVGRANPKYFGFSGARGRFLHWFPGGFQSPGYLANERNYKVAAKSKLDLTAPVEIAATGRGYGEAVLAAYRATNLLYPVEKTRLQKLLRGPEADAFVRAAARFALGEIKTALAQMESLLKPYDNAKWTVATYLPFLWHPQEHMFLKPEVTKDFAARVGHRFASTYQARLDPSVYESLLDLVSKTTVELAELRPCDRIDVQSFIWVVGDYKEGREQPSC